MSLLHVNRTLYSSSPPPYPLPPILTPHPLSYTPGKECEELPVIGSLCLANILGSPQGKHCNSLERCMWKVGSTSKTTIFWREIITFYPKWIWVMLIQGKCKFLFQQPWNMISKVYRLTFLHAQVLVWNWCRVMVSKFRNISYKIATK